MLVETSFIATYFLLLTTVCAGFWILFLDKMGIINQKVKQNVKYK